MCGCMCACVMYLLYLCRHVSPAAFQVLTNFLLCKFCAAAAVAAAPVTVPASCCLAFVHLGAFEQNKKRARKQKKFALLLLLLVAVIVLKLFKQQNMSHWA